MKFNDPYPYTFSWKGNIAVILIISVFVGGFLAVFQPFGLQNTAIPGKIFILLGYGLVNMVILSFDLLVVPMLLPKLFTETRWKVVHQIAFLIFIVFTIGLGNYYYSRYFFGFPPGGASGVLLFQFYTLVIAIFPITVVTILNYNRHLRRNLGLAGDMRRKVEEMPPHPERTDKIISIPVFSKDEKLEVRLSDLFYLHAEGNYIKVLSKRENKIHSTVIRSTMKTIEAELREYFPPLARTHRSYIVNIDLIEDVSGNSQGLLMDLKGLDHKVPVSRGYVERVKELLSL